MPVTAPSLPILLLVAVAPSVVLLSYFYLRDRYDPEPIPHLALAYVLGAYAMLAASGGASAVAGLVGEEWLHLGGQPAKLFDAFVLAGAVEELAKWAILATVVYQWKEFDEPLDGVIYGVAVALGFATLENLFYVSRLGLAVAWQRAVFAVPAHALFGGAVGYYVGKAKFDWQRPRSRRILDHAIGLGLGIAFHGTYNFALHRELGWKVWVAVCVISVALWAFVLHRVKRASRASPFRPKTMVPTMLPGRRPGPRE
jgi:RsiW-degrading membrane proteinase PrsW (M82 family)